MLKFEFLVGIPTKLDKSVVANLYEMHTVIEKTGIFLSDGEIESTELSAVGHDVYKWRSGS